MLSFVTTVASSGIRLAIPFLLTALGETVTEKSGVRNLGLEGIILASAFSSFWVAYNTQSAGLGLAAGLLVGGFIGVFLAIVMVRLGANQLITGVMVTILCTGLSSFLYSKLFGSAIISPLSGFKPIHIPVFSDVPFLGKVLFSHNPLVYAAIALVPLFSFFLSRTNTGLRIRACGENPQTAESVGINVYRVRYFSLVFGSMMAGFAGSYLVLADAKWFSHGMSAGRGWIALAIVIFGRWNSPLVLLGSLLYGVIYALQVGLQTLHIRVVPYQFLLMFPYLMILVTLLISRRETGKPAALGRPFRRSRYF